MLLRKLPAAETSTDLGILVGSNGAAAPALFTVAIGTLPDQDRVVRPHLYSRGRPEQSDVAVKEIELELAAGLHVERQT